MFAPGDQVWLSTRNLPLRLPCWKLGPQCVGPFKVLRRINKVCYRLQITIVLTPRFMCLSSGRWWLVTCRKMRCRRFLRPFWTSRGLRHTLYVPISILDAG
jgi:hypothetical protein